MYSMDYAYDLQVMKNISYTREQTTVVIDPPRRGCDQVFLDQLVALRPRNIIYVSCNVHVRYGDYTYRFDTGS